MSNKIKTINAEGIKLGIELHKLKLDSCKCITHPPDAILNYLGKQFKAIEILYYNTRINKKEKSKTF